METLKFRSRMTGKNMATLPLGSNNSGNGNNGSHHSDNEVDSLLLSSCWSQNSTNSSDYLIDSQKLILDNLATSSDQHHSNRLMNDTSGNEIALDSLLLSSQPINSNLAELKPLPPFTGYTANLSINGIQGHHYHAIAQQHRIPEENNNTYTNYANEHNIVSSSTCISADSLNPDSSVKTLYTVQDDTVSGDIKLEYSSGSDCIINSADSSAAAAAAAAVAAAAQCAVVSQIVKNEMNEYDISSIEDIAEIIGSAIADTTVPNNNQLVDGGDDPSVSRDSWMDLDAWIDGACVDNSSQKNIIISQEGISEFILPHSPSEQCNNNNNNSDYCVSKGQTIIEYATGKSPTVQGLCQQTNSGSSTLQSLLTHGYMPLLQNRLQNGPPSQQQQTVAIIKQEAPSSTSYGGVDLISTSSPPANVVSTTDNILLNGRYIQQTHYSLGGLTDDRIRSPDMLGQNYPHTTTTTPTSVPKKSRNRSQKKSAGGAGSIHHQQQHQHQATSSSNATVFTSEQSLSLLGKEKPVHRCHICNRGFLNKSNIKVHLRTHTGEKPFRCETCAKAFRQKAHLIKHQQIHKRIGRD